jgi:ADP-heptose:LPS heptosyltransferase
LALKKLGITKVTTKTEISVTRQSISKVEAYFREHNIDRDRPLINITPQGKRQSRTWIPENVARLADHLIDKWNAVVFYNYAPGERSYVERVAKMNKNEVLILPQWNLDTFVAFLSLIDLHFSYDNGPKHLAIALGTPTLSLFATDPPVLWNPLNAGLHPFILADVPCNCCGLRNCDLMICMKKITVEDVLEQMGKIPNLFKNNQNNNSLPD